MMFTILPEKASILRHTSNRHGRGLRPFAVKRAPRYPETVLSSPNLCQNHEKDPHHPSEQKSRIVCQTPILHAVDLTAVDSDEP